MIHLDVTNSSVVVEPDGDPSRLATIETLETPGSMSMITAEDGRVLDEEVRTRNSGGRVSRVYAIREPGHYRIMSGLRDNRQSRVFQLRFGALEQGRMLVDILPGSASAPWVVGDHLSHYNGGATMRIAIEIDDVVSVENAGKQEFNRMTAWERILEDDPV